MKKRFFRYGCILSVIMLLITNVPSMDAQEAQEVKVLDTMDIGKGDGPSNIVVLSYIIVNKMSGKGLGVYNPDIDMPQVPSHGVQQWGGWFGTHQLWRISKVGEVNGEAVYVITNEMSGKCLDAPGGAGGVFSVSIQQSECDHNKPNQLWKIQYVDRKDHPYQNKLLKQYYWVKIVNVRSGWCLQSPNSQIISDGTQVQQWKWLHGDNQIWKIVAYTFRPKQ